MTWNSVYLTSDTGVVHVPVCGFLGISARGHVTRCACVKAPHVQQNVQMVYLNNTQGICSTFNTNTTISMPKQAMMLHSMLSTNFLPYIWQHYWHFVLHTSLDTLEGRQGERERRERQAQTEEGQREMQAGREKEERERQAQNVSQTSDWLLMLWAGLDACIHQYLHVILYVCT